jgi:hypothetical protein
MSTSEPFNTLGGYSVGIPPQLVIDSNGNVVTNVNAPNANLTANRVFANSYLYANGQPLSIGASGSNTQVQYNNNGLLGASSSFTFNSATNLLTVTNLQVGNRANLGSVANVVILGGTNGYFLQTDGTGNLTWAPAGNGGNTGNGTPGGSNTQVQYNNAGNFAGNAGFTYNSTTNLLTVGNISTGNITANYIVANWDVTANVVDANYLYGDGSNITNVNAVTAGVANSVAGANVSGQVNFAAIANSVAGANVTGQVNFANVANNVAGANVSGQVANALVAGTVYTAAQPNITSVGNLTSLTVVGNTTLGNQVVANYFIGNLFGLANNARTVTFSSQPNITSVGTLTSLTVSGTTILGNSVSANYFVGTLYGVANTALTANVANVAALANVANFANTAELANNTLYSNTANIANVAYSVSGSNIVGPVASATVAATVSSNAQPNITSVGELSSLVVTGNTTVSNITGNFIGNGARLTNLAGGNVTGTVANATYAVTAGSANTATSANIATTAGTVTTAAQPNITSLGTLNNLEVAGNIISSNITGNFIGNGSRLTNIAGSNVTGTVANAAYALSAGSANTANNANTATTAGTVTTAAQPNITSVGTLSSLSVASNISTTGNVLANSGFVRAGYFIGPLATASQPNITSVGTLTSLTVNGVTNLGNVGNLVIQGGNANYVLSTDGAGNLNWIAQSNGGSSNATPAGSNTYLQYNDNGVFGASANLTYNDSTRNLFVNGNANANGTVTAKTFVSNIADGTAPLQVTSTTPVANLAAQTAATVRSNAQPNITSVGTLTSLAVSGNISGGNVQGGNLISANFVFGTLTTAAQPNITSVGTLTSLGVNGNITGTNITSNTGIFAGNAAGLTNIPGANVTGTVANATYAVTAGSANSATSATTATTAGTVTNNSQPNITSVGTLTNLNVAGNVLAGNLNANNVVLSSNGAFFGNGAGLSSLNASNLTTGTVPNNRLSGSYNINVTNANTANTVVDAIQPNITSVGTLTQLYVNGTANLGNVGNIKIGGGTNGYVLSTDGTGNLSWTAQTGGNGNGTPGGATTQIQYNGDGAFAGSPNLSWTNSTNFLYVGGNATITGRVNASVITSNVSTGTAPFIVVSTTPVANLGVQTAATVRTNAQPNITSVGTLTNLDVSGNIVTNNLTVNTTFTTNGNIVTPLNVFANNGTVRANLLTGILTTATQPNITSIGNLTTLVVTGNVSAGNLSGANSVSANFVTGTLTTNAQPNINYVGNLGWLNVNTSVPNSNGNITFNGSMSGTGAASNITITGNVHAGNFVEANYLVGVLTTNAQPNITSVGTLTGITVNGTANLGNVANVKITGGTNGYVLSTDGAGNLSWVAQSNGGGGNGVPGGSNTQIQFNDAGSFGGSGNFTFNKLTNQFTVAGNSLVTGNSTTSRLISTGATGTSPFVVNSTTPVANLAVETAATVRNGAQPNITSVGTLTGLTVAGNITSNNLTVDNSFSVSNNIIAGGNIFANNGTVRGNLLTGTLTTSLQPNITSVGTLSNLSVTGNATVGNLLGANLVSANFVTGTLTTNAQPNINYVGNLGYLNVDTAVANGNGNIVFNARYWCSK